MSDERLLHALAKVAREKQPPESFDLDERWDRLLAGTLSPAEDAELRALAERSAAARDAYQAFRPLDATFEQRVLGAVRAQQAAEKAARGPTEPKRNFLAWRAWQAWVGGAVAAAGAAAVFVVAMVSPAAQSVVPQLALVTTYGLGEVAARGGTASSNQEKAYTAGSQMPIVGQFATPVPESAKLAFQPYLLRRGSDLFALTPELPPDRLPDAVRLTVKVRDDVPPDHWRTLIVTALPGKLPSDEELKQAIIRSPHASSWRDKAWCARASQETVQIVSPSR